MLLPGAFATALAPIPPVDPPPCHYASCAPVAAVATPAPAAAATWIVSPPNNAPLPPAPNDTFVAFTAAGLYLEVRNVSGTIAVLRDAADAASASFSYTPDEKGGLREADGAHRFGDVTLRVRAYGTSGSWAQASTTVARPGGPVAPRTAPRLPGAALWAADLTPLLNATAAFAAAAPGLSVARELAAAPDGVGIVMSLVLTNSGREAVEVGGLDISLVTDNDWTGLSLEQNGCVVVPQRRVLHAVALHDRALCERHDQQRCPRPSAPTTRGACSCLPWRPAGLGLSSLLRGL